MTKSLVRRSEPRCEIRVADGGNSGAAFYVKGDFDYVLRELAAAGDGFTVFVASWHSEMSGWKDSGPLAVAPRHVRSVVPIDSRHIEHDQEA